MALSVIDENSEYMEQSQLSKSFTSRTNYDNSNSNQITSQSGMRVGSGPPLPQELSRLSMDSVNPSFTEVKDDEIPKFTTEDQVTSNSLMATAD